MNTFKSLTLFFLFYVAIACSDSHEPETYRSINLDLKSQEAVEASNQFGFNLFGILSKETNENLMISPLSISQALCMVSNGANGSTFNEMTSALSFPDYQIGELNDANQTIRDELLGADSKVTMDIANSIWYRDSYPISADFVSSNQVYYDADVKALDFSDGARAKEIINDWVNSKTKGRIEEIVEEINDAHMMFLINAIYFKGRWTYRFDKENTKDDAFFLMDGSTIHVPSMSVEADLGYYSGAAGKCVSIPYGNGHFEMVIAMPNNGEGLAQFVDNLNDAQWKEMTDNMVERGVALSLPKFSFASKQQLNDPLIALGMSTAFSDRADFSLMNENGISDLKISKVLHKSFVEVNEEGTEAAAVTSVSMELTSIGGEGASIIFNVNQPFVFAIREKDTGVILFLGQVYQPEAAN
ncbi:serpin family protein [Carboxylicivirga sp. RSCT41]|uniref:serpin family protein n=1 Tax=Carboxylicivirga agarovorans TaxID=3417570 RepID=UPI003D33A17E